MKNSHQLQVRKGWHVSIDDHNFQVVDLSFDEKRHRHYTLRSQNGEVQTVRRDRIIELKKSGRLGIITSAKANCVGKIDQIRDYAERGHSISYTAKTLGLYARDIRRIIEIIGAGDIEFMRGPESLGFKENLEKLHADRRGRPQPNQSPEVYAALARGRGTLRQRYLQRLTCGMASQKNVVPQKQEQPGMGRYHQLASKDIEQVRWWAARGHSFSFTARTLGISNGRLRKFLDINRTDIKFVDGMKSLASLRRLEELHERQRGFATKAQIAALERAREARGCSKYTAFGMTSYLRELVENFGVVSQKSVRSRLKKGMPIEEALTAPYRKPPRGVIPPQLLGQVQNLRRAAAARIYPIIVQRLTSTMLQYRSSECEIVVTHQRLGCIEVEVRRADVVLHRLSFLKTFDSGVLFVFNAVTDGQLDFIAFEPDSSAVLPVQLPASSMNGITRHGLAG